MGKAEEFAHALKKIYVSAPLSFGVLAIVCLVYPDGWIFLFSAFFSYVLSDFLLNFFIHGGNGWAKIFDETDFANKGHAYLVFLIGIVVGTLLSSFGGESLMTYLQSQMPWYQASLLTDLLAVSAIVGDLEWRFYSK